MESGTLELLRCLQSGPYDESGWKNIRNLLRGQRRYLRAEADTSTLSDLVQLLESWSRGCENPRLGAEALREAADIAERELHQSERAVELRKRALTLSHGTGAGAGALRAPVAQAQPRPRNDAHELDREIETCEAALNEQADMDVVYKLAELYVQRGRDGDAEQAADLFCTLGDLLGNPAGMPMLQRALEQQPDHEEALALFQQYGGAAALEPSAPSQRPRSSATDPTAGTDEHKLHRIATHQTVAGLGPPSISPIASQASPLASDARGAASGPLVRPKLQSSTLGSPGSRARTQRGPSAPLVAPAPHGAISDSIVPNPQPDVATPTPLNTIEAETTHEAPTASMSAAAAIAGGSAGPKGPPPLKRARELQPVPQSAPVITIVQKPGISGAPVAPVSSLSPVVVDGDALERSRERLHQSRKRKRTIWAATIAATTAAAVVVIMVAPRSFEDVKQLAGIGGPETSSSTATATQPPTPLENPAPVDETPKATEAAGAPAPSVTPEPSAAQPAAPEPTPTDTPAVALTEPAHAPEPNAPSILPLLDDVVLRGGKLTPAQLTAAMSKLQPKLDKCYAETLEKKPRLKGRLTLAWTVRPNGKAVSAKKQGGTVKDADLIKCATKAITGTRFPKPKKQATQIRMPFELRKS